MHLLLHSVWRSSGAAVFFAPKLLLLLLRLTALYHIYHISQKKKLESMGCDCGHSQVFPSTGRSDYFFSTCSNFDDPPFVSEFAVGAVW